MRSALVNSLYCTDECCECVLYTHHVDFLEFFPGNRDHHHFSEDEGRHEFQLVCHGEVGHGQVEDEDEDAASGFSRGSQKYRHPVFEIDIVVEVFYFVVDAVDVVDVSVSEFVLSPPCEHLASSGIG